MHEFSLVRSLLEQVDEIVVSNHGRSAKEIHVEIGPLSGVEPLLVKEAFEQLAGSRIRETSIRILTNSATTLVINEVPLTASCDSCHAEFELSGFRFLCPNCGSRETRILRGDEFRLVSVTVDVPDDDADARTTRDSLQVISPS